MDYRMVLINAYINSIKELNSAPDILNYLGYLYYIQESEQALERAIQIEKELLSEVDYE